MRRMITFTQEKVCFNYRIVGFALRDDHVLLHRAERDDFWSLPGGRGELLEPSADTLKREMHEELGIEIHVERLVWIVENFFELNGQSFHEIALYFLMAFPPGSPLYEKQEPFSGGEEDIRLIFQWFPLDNLENVRLFPTFLRKALKKIPDGIEHVVHTDSQE